jgi:hypothetical protein
MRWQRLFLVLLVFCAWRNAPAQPPPTAEELGVDEAELGEQVRQGRLSKDELIRRGENAGYFTRLRLYLYAKELEPFFEGVEDCFRDLARAEPTDKEALGRGLAALSQAARAAYKRLASSGREQWQDEWRRGLLGLIFLDQDWRKRVYEQGKDEIKNPYDLVALVDCLDARLRGLEEGDLARCPLRSLPADAAFGQVKAP